MSVPTYSSRARLDALRASTLLRHGFDPKSNVGLPAGNRTETPPLEPATDPSGTASVHQPVPLPLEQPRPPRRRTLREQREHKEAQRAAADERWEKAHRERQRARGANNARPPVWKREVWLMSRDILADPSGRAVLMWLCRLRRSHSGTPIWAIVRAALGVRTDEQLTRTWRDGRARCVSVIGLAQLMLSRETNRRSQWRRCVRGYSVANFRALLRSPWEPRTPSRTAVSGRAGRYRGYQRALEEAGFCYSQQLPSSEVASWEIGSATGHAYNRYWIVGLTSACSFATELRLQAWHVAGWAAAEADPKHRAPRAIAQAPP